MKRKASRKPAARKRSALARPHPAGPLVLDSECLVENADALKQELLRRLERPAPLCFDVSQVRTIDTASLQVLVAFARDSRVAGREVEWVGVPSVLADTARLLGLSSMLGLPAAHEALPA